MVRFDQIMVANHTGTSFIRGHRSFIVATDKIDSFTKEEISIQQKIIPIGKLYRQQVLKELK
jgi:DNA-binding LytR/AlgR family response regulator